jgi:hypothetical protein
MSLSAAEQRRIQSTIDASSMWERRRMQQDAEATLAQLRAVMRDGPLSEDQRKAGEIALEMLTRLEATHLERGWWYRLKRRLQLLSIHLGATKVATFVILSSPAGT